MKTREVTDTILPWLDDPQVDVIIFNMLSSDMLKHTGMYEVAKKANEVTDENVGRILENLRLKREELLEKIGIDLKEEGLSQLIETMESQNFNDFLRKLEVLQRGGLAERYKEWSREVPILVLTADHGASEDGLHEQLEKSGVAHTANPVPYIVWEPLNPHKTFELKKGKSIVNNAPTLLHLIGSDRPECYEESLLPDDYEGYRRRLLFGVLDGWGINPNQTYPFDAIRLAQTPHYDWLVEKANFVPVEAHGEVIGLRRQLSPWNEKAHHDSKKQPGQTPEGHQALGAGRKIKQAIVLIDELIEGGLRDGAFDKNHPLLQPIVEKMKSVIAKGGKFVHIGFGSEGGVHACLSHMFALMRMAEELGMNKDQFVMIFIAEGRDTLDRRSAHLFLQDVREQIDQIGIGEIVSVFGRADFVRKEGFRYQTDRIIAATLSSDFDRFYKETEKMKAINRLENYLKDGNEVQARELVMEMLESDEDYTAIFSERLEANSKNEEARFYFKTASAINSSEGEGADEAMSASEDKGIALTIYDALMKSKDRQRRTSVEIAQSTGIDEEVVARILDLMVASEIAQREGGASTRTALYGLSSYETADVTRIRDGIKVHLPKTAEIASDQMLKAANRKRKSIVDPRKKGYVLTVFDEVRSSSEQDPITPEEVARATSMGVSTAKEILKRMVIYLHMQRKGSPQDKNASYWFKDYKARHMNKMRKVIEEVMPKDAKVSRYDWLKLSLHLAIVPKGSTGKPKSIYQIELEKAFLTDPYKWLFMGLTHAGIDAAVVSRISGRIHEDEMQELIELLKNHKALDRFERVNVWLNEKGKLSPELYVELLTLRRAGKNIYEQPDRAMSAADPQVQADRALWQDWSALTTNLRRGQIEWLREGRARSLLLRSDWLRFYLFPNPILKAVVLEEKDLEIKGPRLRALRESFDLTLLDVAEMADISESTVSHYEKAGEKVSEEILRRIILSIREYVHLRYGGQRLKELREKYGVAVSQVEGEAKVVAHLIEDYETGEANVDIEVLAQIYVAIKKIAMKRRGGKKFRRLYKAFDISQSELNRRTQTSFKTINNIERRNPDTPFDVFTAMLDMVRQKALDEFTKDKLRALRQAFDLTVEDLAGKARVTRKVVRKYENDNRDVNLFILMKIVNAIRKHAIEHFAGSRLRDLRVAFDLDKQDVADLSGLSRGTIANYEKDDKEYSLVVLMSIVNALRKLAVQSYSGINGKVLRETFEVTPADIHEKTEIDSDTIFINENGYCRIDLLDLAKIANASNAQIRQHYSGPQLKRMRKLVGLTQQEIAASEDVDISQMRLSVYEGGDTWLKVAKLATIVRFIKEKANKKWGGYRLGYVRQLLGLTQEDIVNRTAIDSNTINEYENSYGEKDLLVLCPILQAIEDEAAESYTGSRLDEMILMTGLRKSDIAGQAGVSRATLLRYCKSQEVFDFESLEKMVRLVRAKASKLYSGWRIKELRKLLGISKEDLAQQTGLDLEALEAFESFRQVMSLQVLVSILKVFEKKALAKLSGKRLKRLRERVHLATDAVAREAGTDNATIEAYEQDHSPKSFVMLIAILRAIRALQVTRYSVERGSDGEVILVERPYHAQMFIRLLVQRNEQEKDGVINLISVEDMLELVVEKFARITPERIERDIFIASGMSGGSFYVALTNDMFTAFKVWLDEQNEKIDIQIGVPCDIFS